MGSTHAGANTRDGMVRGGFSSVTRLERCAAIPGIQNSPDFEQMARERVIAGAIGLVPEAQALGALDDEGKLRSGFGPGGFGGEGFGPGGCGAPPPGLGPDGAGLGGMPTGLLDPATTQAFEAAKISQLLQVSM